MANVSEHEKSFIQRIVSEKILCTDCAFKPRCAGGVDACPIIHSKTDPKFQNLNRRML